MPLLPLLFFFFFNDTATTEIYTLSLHDALPISRRYFPKTLLLFIPSILFTIVHFVFIPQPNDAYYTMHFDPGILDRKSTRLNSSHQIISYAVFCLKKKKTLYHH